jgi:hypothetical protein
LPISEDAFTSASKNLGDSLFAVRAESDDIPKPVFEGKQPPRR